MPVKTNSARGSLSKFLLRNGRRPSDCVKKSWMVKYMTWIKEQVHFAEPAVEATLRGYVHKVDHMAERIQQLEKAINEAIPKLPTAMQEVLRDLQACAAWRW